MCWFAIEKVTVNLQEMGRPDGAQAAAWQGACRVTCPFKVMQIPIAYTEQGMWQLGSFLDMLAEVKLQI